MSRAGVGKVVNTVDVGQMSLVLYRNAIAASNTGGIRETRDMIAFCEHSKERERRRPRHKTQAGAPTRKVQAQPPA